MRRPQALIHGACFLLLIGVCAAQTPTVPAQALPEQPPATTSKPDTPSTTAPAAGAAPVVAVATANPVALEPKLPANLQQLRPNALPYRIERKNFGPNKSFKRVEFFWVVPKTKPKAYVVLATNMAKPRLPLEDRQWAEFAEKNQLGLISVGLDELNDTGRVIEKGGDLEGRVLRLADEVFGPGLKGTFFASDRGAYWMHRVVMRKPWLWGFWCSRDVAHYPPVPRGIEYPSGLVLNTSPSQYESNLFFFQDLRRTKITNRVGFASLNGKALDAAYVDRFAQQYLLAVLAGGNAASLWFDIHSEANCALLEKPPPPQFQSWVPGDEVPGAWKLLHEEQKKLPDSQVAFADVRLLDGKQVKLVYRVPGKVKQGVPVRHVVICLLWAENDVELQKKVQSSTDYKAALWNRDRVGVIAINAKSLGFVADLPSARTLAELKELKQSMSIYAPAFWQVIGKANGELGWPTAQYHLLGSGIGASIAQAWAYAEPARFLSVHLNGGGPYLDVDPAMATTCWLLTTGGKSAGYDLTVKHYAAAKKAGWPVMFNSRQGASGGMEDWVWTSGSQFFNHTRDMADLLKKEQTEGKPPSAPTAAALIVQRLRESAFLMELDTRKVVHLADASLIPDEKRISLPTVEIEEAWRIEGAPKPAVPQPTAPGAQSAAATPPATAPAKSGVAAPPPSPAPPANTSGSQPPAPKPLVPAKP